MNHKIKKSFYCETSSSGINHKAILFSKCAPIILLALTLFAFNTNSLAAESIKQEKIEIMRDAYGIPHIFAETNNAVYYGAGWTYAENYAPMFIYEVLNSLGTLSEHFDTGIDENGESIISTDVEALALGYYEKAKNWTKLPQTVIDALTAFSNGFNDYVAATDKSGELKTRFLDSSMNAYNVVKSFGKLTPRQLVAFAIMNNTVESIGNMKHTDVSYYSSSLQRTRGPHGSNAAAISDYKMDYGYSALYGDSHNFWYGYIPAAHLHSNTLDIFSIFSGPFASDGRFNSYAVASPRTRPDTADIYNELINPSNQLQYLSNNQWKDFEVKTFVIKNSKNQKIEKKLFFTDRGWVFDYEENSKSQNTVHSIRISVCDTTFDEMTPLKYVTQRFYQSWSNNIYDYYFLNKTPYASNHSNVLSDDTGNIAYIWNGRIPVRHNQLSGSRNIDFSEPLNGNNPMTNWSPKVWRLGDPEFSLPFFFNPRGGVLRAANDAPWYASGCDDENAERFSWASQALVPLKNESTPRGKRLKEILCETPTFSVDSLIENLVFDTLSPQARDFMHSIEKGWAANANNLKNYEINENALKLDSILRKWNFRADIDQPGMTVMFHFKRVSPLPWFDGEYTPSLYEMSIYLAYLELTASDMKDLYGKLEVPWGDIHVVKVQNKEISLPGGTKNIPTLMQSYMLSRTQEESQGETYPDNMYGETKKETNPKLIGKILCNFGSSSIHLHIMNPKGIETYFVSSQGPTNPDFFPDSNHLTQYPVLFSQKKLPKVPSTREEVLKELCPWGKDPKHEHKDITILYYPPK